MPLKLEQSLRERLDVFAASEAEAAYVPSYIPPSMLTPALEGRGVELVRLLEGLYRRGLDVEEAEVIQVAK